MNRTLFIFAVIFATGLGLAVNRAIPKRLQNEPPIAQSAVVAATPHAGLIIAAVAEAYYPVTKVVDGDTIAVNINGENTTIRLIGLDTPETVDPRRPVQCFGKQANDKAKELLTGKKVRIEMDPSQGELDKYGRLLAYLYLEDLPAQAGGILFNKLMIAEGFGHEYTYNLPYKYQEEFKVAETAAREQKKGLWAPEACQDTKKESVTDRTYPIRPTMLSTESYECLRNTYNCSSFKTQAEAQYVFELCGLPAAPARASHAGGTSAAQAGGNQNDVHKLDRDGDGNVCESLP